MTNVQVQRTLGEKTMGNFAVKKKSIVVHVEKRMRLFQLYGGDLKIS